jgi:small subunit ribosomal protein S18
MTRKSTRSRRLLPAPPKVAKNNLLDTLGVTAVNYKDTARLRMFISERGKIRSRRVTGLTVQQQRQIAMAIKNAREVALFAVPVIRRAVTGMFAPLWRQVVHDNG